MKLLWLGQSGLLFDFDGIKIMIDPYLTDSLSKVDSEFTRKTKINRKLFRAKPDIIILTNCHSDHADNASIEKLLKHTGRKKRVTILSCESVYDEITTAPSMAHANHIMFEKYSEWTVGNVNIQAVPAKTDDKTAFGVVITDFTNGKKYYVAGDTLYSKIVLDNLPSDIYAAFLPINGEFGSMNVADAKRFAEKIQARFCVPVHFGMFDKIKPSTFDVSNAIISKPYKIINFDDYETNEAELENQEENEAEESNQGSNESADTAMVIGVSADEEIESAEIENEEITVYEDCAESVSEIEETNVQDDFSESDDVIENTYANELNLEAEAVCENEVVNEIAIEEEACYNESNFEYEVENQENIEVKKDSFNEADVQNDFEENVIENDDTCDSFEESKFADIESDTPSKIMDDSDKIDAYIREIEKFERGETTDFAAIDDNE